MLVAEATDGRDPELVIAAPLHDAIEDCEVPKEMIAAAFGEEVASLVLEVTDDKQMEKSERKRRQVELAAKKSPRAKLLKLADKTSNLRAIAASPPPDWSVTRKIEYVAWARSVAAGQALGSGVARRLASNWIVPFHGSAIREGPNVARCQAGFSWAPSSPS
jgi:guanosine-3',5'-bis(diphosphate) 3'-pyrophosphohydrolase